MGVRNGRRKDKRLFITYDKSPRVTIMLPGHRNRAISTRLLNLCPGGLSFIIPKKETRRIDIGDPLAINFIQLPVPYGKIQHVEARIRYIIEVANYFEVSIGCELIQSSSERRRKIIELIAGQLHSKLQ